MKKYPRVTVDCVVFGKEGVVLIKRANKPFKGRYALPGGFVEVGETVEQACVRETLEETGLRVKSLQLIGVYSKPGRDPRGHTVSVAFLAQANLSHLLAGSDAASAEVVNNWRRSIIAFDHKTIIKDAWKLAHSWS